MRAAWDQKLSETDSEFRAFDRWLHSDPRPLPSEQRLAAQHDWADRAAAFDLLHALPEDTGECFAETVDTMVRGALIQSRRWLQQLVAIPQDEIDPKQIARILETVARIKEVADAGRKEPTKDFSALTEDDLWVILEAGKVERLLR